MNFRNLSITLICIILGLILSWQFKSINKNNEMKNLQNVRLESLKDEILFEKKRNEDLRKKLDELEASREKYEAALDNRGLIEENLKKELESARIVAGLTDVRGKGLEVTLYDDGISQVTDADIMNLVNELKASEAQAISVNNERIVALSEIRKGGNYIVINGRQITRPYVIRAIAEPARLENALNIVGGVVDNLSYYKIKHSLEKKDEILIPKVDISRIKTNYLEIVK